MIPNDFDYGLAAVIVIVALQTVLIVVGFIVAWWRGELRK